MKRALIILSIIYSQVSFGQNFVTLGAATPNIALKQQNLQWVNVLDYGADSTGLTDNSVAFRAAQAAIATRGGTFYIPHGRYLFTDTFLITKPLKIIGEGASTDSYSADTAVTQIICASNIRMWTFTRFVNIDDVLFKWTGASASTSGCAIYMNVGYGGYDANFNLNRVSIDGFYDNLYINRASTWTIDKSFFVNASRYNTYVNNTFCPDCGDWAISNSFFLNNLTTSDYGLYIVGSGGGKVVNCKFNGNYKTMIYGIYDSLPGTVITLITNCSFENFSSSAIYAANVHDVVITGCEISPYNPTSISPYINVVSGVSVIIANNVFIAGLVGDVAVNLASSESKISSNEYAGFTSTTPFTITGTHSYNFDLDKNGNFSLLNLKTGSTAPTTSGTVQNVVTDANGQMSFLSLPITAQTTLVSGTKAVAVTGVTSSSKATVSLVSSGGTVTTTWQYAVVCTAGTVTITAITTAGATNTSDTSVLTYTVTP